MTIIYFILILGAVIFVHEFGHFIFAKVSKTYVYEFSIGMGPKLFGKKGRNGETDYCLRLIPLGGFVRLAGEEIDDDKTVKDDRKLYNKSFWQRFLIMFAGAGFNFLFAIILLFCLGIAGTTTTKPVIGVVDEQYPAYTSGVREGDTILSINDVSIDSWDDIVWELHLNGSNEANIKVLDNNNVQKTFKIKPVEEKENDVVNYKFGISQPTKIYSGLSNGFNYAFNKTKSLFKTMFNTFSSLFNGNVSVKKLSGPIGIYSVVDTQAKAGFSSLIYLVAFLCINVGFINLIPFPAFDGGRILFLIIEKIKGSPVSPKVENTIHSIGFILLILLMIFVTFNDIFRLFG